MAGTGSSRMTRRWRRRRNRRRRRIKRGRRKTNGLGRCGKVRARGRRGSTEGCEARPRLVAKRCGGCGSSGGSGSTQDRPHHCPSCCLLVATNLRIGFTGRGCGGIVVPSNCPLVWMPSLCTPHSPLQGEWGLWGHLLTHGWWI